MPRSMTETTDGRYTADEYFGLVDRGVLDPDDKVELLEGVIVTVAAQNPPHASAVALVNEVIRGAVQSRAVVRVQVPLVLGQQSVPEPDVAVVPGKLSDYYRQHPTTALLVVEVADRSLPQDRLTKTRTYAAAGIPEYWIVNLRDGCVEVCRDPDVSTAVYRSRRVAGRGETLSLVAFPDAAVAVSDVLPEGATAEE